MAMLASQIKDYLERASWIRRMFEAGIELKKQYGQEAVFDFSLGNPDLPPPPAVKTALTEIAAGADKPFALGYMPNPGYPDVRAALAAQLSKEQGVSVAAGDVILTCGAAGGLNAFFRAVLEPCDEVVCPAPFFVEYGFYVQNFGGGLVPVKALPPDFGLDVPAMVAAVNEKTRVVLINSPNNPTGAIYPREQLEALAQGLREKSARFGRPIYLVSDEPYRFLAYDGAEVPSLLPLYEHSVVASSFSKNLSLAGERVGYLLVNPAMPDKEELLAGLVLTNRILGYVNAPAIGQKIMAKALGSQVDVSVYAARRAAMAEVLDAAGIEYAMPGGGFYFFPKAPGGDDLAFVNKLQAERVLAVPGTGFGYPGFFRLAFCVDEKVIRRSAESFARAMK